MTYLVARKGDMQMLEQRLKSAKSVQEREVIQKKMNDIIREARDPVIQNLRRQLVGAVREGDARAQEAISEELHIHQIKIGKIRKD